MLYAPVIVTQAYRPAHGIGAAVHQGRKARVKMDEILDRIDTPEFFNRTEIASGHNTVRDILLTTPEVRYAVERASESVPRIARRMETPGGVKNDTTPIAFFTIFQQTRDPRALPVLARYLDGEPDSEANAVRSPWHPFYYAVQAVNAFVAVSPPADSDLDDLFAARHKIADQARRRSNSR